MKRLCVCVAFLTLIPKALAQLPSDAVERVQRAIGSRVETMIVLGGDYAAGGGDYTFRGGSHADVTVSKAGGGGDLASRPLGETGLTWSPMILGNVGLMRAENDFDTTIIAGNGMEYRSVAVQAGGGASFHFNDCLTLTPILSGIYGHTENEFIARNAAGSTFEQAASGKLVDWDLDTWTIAPAFEVTYEWKWRRTVVELSSHYGYFYTEDFNSPSVLVRINGASHLLENKIDVDVPTGWRLFGNELHSGGFFSRTELWGGVSDGLRENHLYTANGRFVMDFLGKVWGLRWMGLGASWTWADHFSGWSLGVDIRLQF